MVNILVFGTGGVGSVYTYILSQAGCSVTSVCRSNYSVAKEHGLSINSQKFGEVKTKPNVVRHASEAEGEFEYIVICAKAIPSDDPSKSLPSLIKQAVGPNTSIVLAQNGIGIEEDYARAFPNNTILSGVVYLPVTQVSPGQIEMGNMEDFELGTYPSNASPDCKSAAQKYAELHREGGGSCILLDDIQPSRWSKLVLNASWNPICALSYLDDASFLSVTDIAESVVRGAMLEVKDVAHAQGYENITEEVVDTQLSRAKDRLNAGKGINPSMLTDLRNGRGMEVEAILGNTIKIARTFDVKVPRLDLLYALTKGLDTAIQRGSILAGSTRV